MSPAPTTTRGAPQPEPGVIILAAGLGKRMKSEKPKVLHALAGSPMIVHILRHVISVAPRASIAVVVGHGREEVQKALSTAPELKGTDLHYIVQSEQKGTGHAAKCAMESAWGAKQVERKAQILVLPGDLPLIPRALVREMLEPMGRDTALRLLTCDLPDPTGYGRIVRRGKTGPVLKIVEERDANARERLLREVGASIYLFQAAFLRFGLDRLQNRNAQSEYYLTDIISMAAKARKKIDVLKWACPEDLRGINDRWELAQARRMLNQRLVRHWAQAGVDFQDPDSAWIDLDVQLAADVSVGAGAQLLGRTRVAKAAVIGPHVLLRNVEVDAGAEVRLGSVVEESSVGQNAKVGPYAHLRPESHVGPECKVGNFVELKKTRLGAKTSVAHLSYLGDAEVGAAVNIGCGFVTCNYDGRVISGSRKHKTIIEDEAFIGSDCQAVAPIKIGRGAFVASGSTVTEDVEADAMAIARARQVNKTGYARKLKTSGEGV